MPNYQLGKIYKIWNLGFDKCYIGSTTQRLSKRMGNHRSQYKEWLRNNKTYCSVYVLFNEFGLESCKIELLENFPCDSKMELEAREGHHQRANECVNKNKCTGSTIASYDNKKQYKKQWNETNKERVAEHIKTYYEANRENILEQKKEYRQRKMQLKEELNAK